MTLHKDARILIIGSGVFGLSTGHNLAERGYKDVTILDRYPPPVPDGSSVDISRVIRPDYADDFYARLGLEAVEGWKTEYKSFFHQSGFLNMTQDLQHPYLEEAKKNVQKLGTKILSFYGNEVKQRYPMIHGDLSRTRGYANESGGWADAEGSIGYLTHKCIEAGVSFISGPRGTVTSLITNGKTITGVNTKAGISINADFIIVATGAWSPHLLNMTQVSVSDAQPIGFIQLTPEEANEIKDCPVMIDLSSGWFCFPPTPDTHLLKFARHGYGFEIIRAAQLSGQQISVPELNNNNAISQFLPDDAEKALRDGLALFLPKFKDRPFVRKRLCWYTDTPKGNFIVDYHSDYSNLFLATGGSGHAFKFLPVIGKYIADAFERKASKEQMEKWAWQPTNEGVSKGDGSRGGPPRRVLSKKERARL